MYVDGKKGMMKKSEMVRKLKIQRWKLLRRGKRHDLYIHGFSDQYAEIPRHASELSNWVMNDILLKMRQVERRMKEESR